MTTVLVVEDNEDILLLAQAYLEPGYDVLTADNAADAVEILKTTKVDVVFSDIMMPGQMNGVGLGLHVRANYEAVGVLLTTGQGHDHQAKQARLPVLLKPYRRQQLVQEIDRIFQNSR